MSVEMNSIIMAGNQRLTAGGPLFQGLVSLAGSGLTKCFEEKLQKTALVNGDALTFEPFGLETRGVKQVM